MDTNMLKTPLQPLGKSYQKVFIMECTQQWSWQQPLADVSSPAPPLPLPTFKHTSCATPLTSGTREIVRVPLQTKLIVTVNRSWFQGLPTPSNKQAELCWFLPLLTVMSFFILNVQIYTTCLQNHLWNHLRIIFVMLLPPFHNILCEPCRPHQPPLSPAEATRARRTNLQRVLLDKVTETHVMLRTFLSSLDHCTRS